jgi:hypothetical protein
MDRLTGKLRFLHAAVCRANESVQAEINRQPNDRDTLKRLRSARLDAVRAYAVAAGMTEDINAMVREDIQPLGDAEDDPEIDRQRGLVGLQRGLYEVRDLINPLIALAAVAGISRIRKGADPLFLRHVEHGVGRRAYADDDLGMIQLIVEHVFIVKAREGLRNAEAVLAQCHPRPTTERQFRGWSERVPLNNRSAASVLGRKLAPTGNIELIPEMILCAGEVLTEIEAERLAALGRFRLSQRIKYVLDHDKTGGGKAPSNGSG